MGKRHEAIGIKQTIRPEWLEKTTNLLLAGLDAKSVRKELHASLASCKGDGSIEERGDISRSQVVTILMKIWVSPEPELIAFRNTALSVLRRHPGKFIVIHWAMISAAYPFWFNVARQTGRLLNLQDRTTVKQITHRLREQYGDRQTVSRYCRYVLRSFVAWGVLRDSEAKGCYEKASHLEIADQDLTILLLEAALHAMPEGKGSLNMLLNAPSFFPFRFLSVKGDLVAMKNPGVELVRYGLDDELLELKTASV